MVDPSATASVLGWNTPIGPSPWYFVDIGIYTGTELTNLTSVDWEEWFDRHAYRFQAVAGQTYFFSTDSSLGFRFDLDLVVAQASLQPVASSQLIAGRTVELEFAALDTNADIVALEAFVGTNSLGVVTGAPFRFTFTSTDSGPISFSASGTNSAGQPVVALATPYIIRPANDDFADAYVIPGDWTDGSFSGDAHYATREQGEATGANTAPQTVWWRWTPASSGDVVITPTPGSLSKVRVYKGNALNALEALPATYVTDRPGPGPPQQSTEQNYIIAFTPEAGATYCIAGDGTGPFAWTLDQRTIAMAPSPSIDPLRARVGAPVALEATWLATSDPVSPVEFMIGTYSYPLIYWPAYSGPEASEAGRIASVSAAPYRTTWAPYTAGIYVVWARTTNSSGVRKESLRTAFQVFAENDDFTNATVIPPAANNTNFTFNTVGSSGEPGEPPHRRTPALRSRWWKWTPSYSGSVRLKAVRDMQGMPLDVFMGTGLNELRRIANNDNRTYQPGFSGAVSLGVRAGRTYYIRVDDTSLAAASPAQPGTPLNFPPPPNIVLSMESTGNPLTGEIFLDLLTSKPGHNGVPIVRPSVRVYLPDGRTPVSGSNFRAQLYVGLGAGVLEPTGTQQPFYADGFPNPGQSQAGTFVPTPVILPGLPAYRPVYAQVRVWDSTYGDTYEAARAGGGLCGTSRVLPVWTGSEILGPTPLNGITNFRVKQP